MEKITVIVPCYNEEAALHYYYKEMSRVMDEMNDVDFELLLVNDGSKDNTLQIIRELAAQKDYIRYLSFSRNFGKEAAMYAGFCNTTGDYVAIMDADLQDDIDAIDGMLEKYAEGCDIVYGVRNARDTDTAFKRKTAEGYYKVMGLLGADIVYNHADYRLMSKRALDGLEQFKEVNLFLRGVVPMIGYKSDKVYYARKERFAGESKYPLKKMLAFAWEGLTSLSVKPIRMIMTLGSAIFLVSIAMLIYSLVRHAMGATMVGWTSTVVSIWAIGGLQLLAIGIIGEYIGKVYLETKQRPKFIVEEYLKDEDAEKKN